MAKKADPNSNPPKASPKSAGLAPVLHPVVDIVVTHHVFIGVGILANDGQGAHVDSRALKLLDCSFCFDMGAINGYHCV
jgi:hypothetical protein